MGPKSDGVWRETGILEKFPEGGPKKLWSVPVGLGYSGPAVAGGKLFVMDRRLGENAQGGENPFKRGQIPGDERILCLNATTGEKIWEHTYPCEYTVSYAAGPRTTPTVDGDRVYSVGAEGHLTCLNVKDGSLVWKTHFAEAYGVKTPVWGFSASPLVVGDLIICLVGGEGSVAVAFDKMTGVEKWKALSAKEPGYAPPTLIDQGGKKQIILWHPEAACSLEPETGKVLWTVPWKQRSGLSVPTPQLVGDRLFFSSFYNGSMLLKLKEDHSTPDILWRTEKVSEKRTVHLNGIMSTPVIREGHIYGVCSYGEFRCLELESGRRVWEDLSATTGEKRPVDGDGNPRKDRWGNAFLTPQGNRCFLFNEHGFLIIAELVKEGYREISRAKLIEPDNPDLRQRKVVWTHPAYANRCIYVRNNSELVCFSLAAQ